MRLNQPKRRPGTRGDFRVLHEFRLGAARNETRKSILDRPPRNEPRWTPLPAVGNNDSMPSWPEIEQDAPDFTLRVRRCFDAGTNKTLATLRRDGAPRINASEIEFSSGGEVTLGMMPGSMKLLDVLRDPRVALHSPTLEPPKDDPNSGPGDAKMSGSLVEIRPCLLYTSPSPRDRTRSRMPSSA